MRVETRLRAGIGAAVLALCFMSFNASASSERKWSEYQLARALSNRFDATIRLHDLSRRFLHFVDIFADGHYTVYFSVERAGVERATYCNLVDRGTRDQSPGFLILDHCDFYGEDGKTEISPEQWRSDLSIPWASISRDRVVIPYKAL